MGKYQDNDEPEPSPGPGIGGSSNAIAMDITPNPDPPMQRYFDDDPAEFDDNDLPPLYTEHDRETVPQVDPLSIGSGADPRLPNFRLHRTDPKSGTAYYIETSTANSEHREFLSNLSALGNIRARPCVHLRGVHHENVKNGDKTERKEIVDFDIEVDLTSLCYSSSLNPNASLKLETVTNFEKVRRGTALATRAPGFGGSGMAEEGQPDVEQWVMRYALSPAGLKCFHFERRVVGWDWNLVRDRLLQMVRETNYRGRTTVDFPVRNAKVEIYNDCRTNRWRLTKWIEMIFVFTLMFLFAWPWLFFRTKRWETVYTTWQIGKREEDRALHESGRVHSYTEGEFFNVWGRALQKAVLGRRQGLLTNADLRDAEGAQVREEGFAGMVQAGVEAMGVVNRSFGWGGDR